MYRTRSLSLRTREVSPTSSKLAHKNPAEINEFKVPEILATPRRSVRTSKPLKNITNESPLLPPLNIIKKSQSVTRPNMGIPPSPRTPRRSCRDQTIARIHQCNSFSDSIRIAAFEPKNQQDNSYNPPKVMDVSTESMSEQSSETSETERCSGDEIDLAVVKSKKNVSRRAKKTPKYPRETIKSSHVLVNRINPSQDCLQGRETEFENIYDFIYNKLIDNIGGCIYIAGLPGTGKTATVHAVLKTITADFSQVKIVLVNGMQVNEPREVYLDIYNQLFPTKSSDIKMAINRLENEFGSRKKIKATLTAPVILVIDELDLLCSSTKRQDVLYTIFDWGTRPNVSTAKNPRASLIVLCIANTMDLPERLLHSRVASRLGVSRLIFSPYTHQQLTNIILNCKLLTTFEQSQGNCVYCDPIAIALIARKVAAISGDARRALEITRRVSDKARANPGNDNIPRVTMSTVDEVIKEIFQGTPIVSIIQNCLSLKEKTFLKALLSSIKSMKNADETSLFEVKKVLRDYQAITNDFNWLPTLTEMFQVCSSLAAQKLILLSTGSISDNIKSGTIFSTLGIYSKLRLNCSTSDLLFALGMQVNS